MIDSSYAMKLGSISACSTAPFGGVGISLITRTPTHGSSERFKKKNVRKLARNVVTCNESAKSSEKKNSGKCRIRVREHVDR